MNDKVTRLDLVRGVIQAEVLKVYRREKERGRDDTECRNVAVATVRLKMTQHSADTIRRELGRLLDPRTPSGTARSSATRQPPSPDGPSGFNPGNWRLPT